MSRELSRKWKPNCRHEAERLRVSRFEPNKLKYHCQTELLPMNESLNEGLPQTTDAYFVTANEGSRHDLFPGVDILTTAGEHMMLSVVHFAPGSVVPRHSHPHEQMGIMLSGRLRFNVNGVVRVLGPGDKWRIPGGVPHDVTALDEPAVALDVFHPIREDYR